MAERSRGFVIVPRFRHRSVKALTDYALDIHAVFKQLPHFEQLSDDVMIALCPLPDENGRVWSHWQIYDDSRDSVRPPRKWTCECEGKDLRPIHLANMARELVEGYRGQRLPAPPSYDDPLPPLPDWMRGRPMEIEAARQAAVEEVLEAERKEHALLRYRIVPERSKLPPFEITEDEWADGPWEPQGSRAQSALGLAPEDAGKLTTALQRGRWSVWEGVGWRTLTKREAIVAQRAVTWTRRDGGLPPVPRVDPALLGMIVPRLLKRRAIPYLCGARQIGKTNVVHEIAVGLACNRRILDQFDPPRWTEEERTRNVLVIDGENIPEDIEPLLFDAHGMEHGGVMGGVDWYREKGSDRTPETGDVLFIVYLNVERRYATLFDMSDEYQLLDWLEIVENVGIRPRFVIADGVTAMVGSHIEDYGPWSSGFFDFVNATGAASGLAVMHTTGKDDTEPSWGIRSAAGFSGGITMRKERGGRRMLSAGSRVDRRTAFDGLEIVLNERGRSLAVDRDQEKERERIEADTTAERERVERERQREASADAVLETRRLQLHAAASTEWKTSGELGCASSGRAFYSDLDRLAELVADGRFKKHVDKNLWRLPEQGQPDE